MKEVDSDELLSSDDEKAIKNKEDARKLKIKNNNIKEYLKKKNSRGNLAVATDIINIFAIGDDNKINVEDLEKKADMVKEKMKKK